MLGYGFSCERDFPAQFLEGCDTILEEVVEDDNTGWVGEGFGPEGLVIGQGVKDWGFGKGHGNQLDW